jgi:hypothetical protein
VLTAGALALYLAAFAWLGICCSVTARNTRLAIGRAIPLALLIGGGFWIFPGCCGVCLGAGGGRGIGELLLNGYAFLAGFTPPAVLGGVTAVDFEVIHEATRPGPYRDRSPLVSLVCGGIFGTGAWVWAVFALRLKATALFEKEANREPGRRGADPDDRYDDLARFSPPSPEPPPANPPGSWGTGATS